MILVRHGDKVLAIASVRSSIFTLSLVVHPVPGC